MDKCISVFDSGLGGLTNVKELHKILKGENIVYFGDTGRVPYGTRSDDIILKYTLQDLRFLTSFPVKAIIVACGTVSSVALPKIKDRIDVPIIGVVEPACQKAVKITKNKKIGIIGTEGTIKSGAYKKKLLMEDETLKIYENACPLFVPLVENGYLESEATKIIVKDYLLPFKEKGIDTLILGCTHYPLLTKVISEFMGDEVCLVSPGVETASYAKELLENKGLLNKSDTLGKTEYYVSDNVEKFSYLASMFLDDKVFENVKKINIEDW